MLKINAEQRVPRREFMKSALAVSGVAAADILFGTTSSIWRQSIWRSGGGAPEPEHDLAFWIKRVAELGLQGIEPYGDQIEKYRSNPMALKKLFDEAGITFIDASNGEQGQSTNFIDQDQIPKTIADHVAFARDFLQPLGADHWKVNMGARPPGGPSEEQLKRLADTLNELGRRTIAMGIRLAPHPHIWGPLEREKDMRRVMELTDPKYVWMTADTGHLELGGGDAAATLRRRRRTWQRSPASITIWAAAASTSLPCSRYCAIGTSKAGRFSTSMPRERVTTGSVPSAATSIWRWTITWR